MTQDDTLDADQADAVQDADAELADASEAGLRQFVSFYLGEECFAFPMAKVQEIIRLPATVAVPMTPQALIGLANLRGVVLPVVDLRSVLDLERVETDDASRVIVVNTGKMTGLVVDRVARVMNVPDEAIEPASSVEHSIGAEDLIGVARDGASGLLVQLVDPAGLLARHFPESEKAGARLTGQVQARAADGDKAQDDTIQLVNVMLDGEEYGFPIDEVDEIVRVPDRIARVPGADHHVLGLVSLRRRLLPLVCLRRIFALEGSALSDTNRVVVLRLEAADGEEVRVGVVVDHVREVLRIPNSVRDQLPSVLRRGDHNEIGGICQLENGKRLVSVLSGGALFRLPDLREMIEEAELDAGIGEDVDEKMEAQEMSDTDEAQLVVCQLGGQEFGIDIHSVQEIIRIPENLARVPRTPEAVEGIINLRGTVLPVVELRRGFGLDALPRNDRQRILVLNINGQRTGYIVDSVSEVLRLPLSRMEPAPGMSEEAARLVGRVANLDNGKRMVLVLNAEPLVEELGEMSRAERDRLMALAS